MPRCQPSRRLSVLLGCFPGLLFAALLAWAPAVAWAEGESTDKRRVVLAGGAIELQFPETWQPKAPDNNIVDFEFAVPPSEGEKDPGRVTVMGAGGPVDKNIERWVSQFSQPDGSDTEKVVKKTESTISGLDVVVVDISGTYKDSRGPFSGIPAVERPKYRMLAAIIRSKTRGQYFVKFYGGQQTVADNEKAFQKLIDSVKAN